MKKVSVFCLLLVLWLGSGGASVWAVDVGWMQEGVRIWYFGSGGSVSSSDTEEAYLFTSISGNTAQITHNSGTNHWSLPTTETVTGSVIDQGPFWIHPQALQSITVGDTWMGIDITSMTRAIYTYDTFKNNSEFASLPYLLLPIKTLFDLQPQREIVKLVYGIPYWPGYDVWGTAFFDAETGLCLFNLKLTVYNTVWFLLSEINYDFANRTAFAEDNGPHTGFKSTIIKTSNTGQYVMIQSSVETRYGDTVQMWTSTSAGGSINLYSPPNENFCFFGSIPVLRHKNMTDTPNYPPENWNAYGEYLWWWVPTETLQKSTINVFDVPMTRTSTAPYTFTATGTQAGFYFSKLIFDNDGYMTDFAAKDSAIGLDIGLGTFAPQPINLVDGLSYYKNTMGNAVPASPATVTTATISGITASTAVCGGNVTADGGAAVTARGVCWSATANPTTADSCTSDGPGTGAYASDITGLTSNTLYHVRAYATNSAGTAYGGDVIFTTLVDGIPPTVNSFVLPAASPYLTVDITAFTATDNVGVAGFGLSSVNDPASCTWSGTAPTSYTFSGEGTWELYAWARDAVGNISAPATASILVASPKGDCNWDTKVDISDALFALRATVGLITPTPAQKLQMDVAPLVNGKPAPNGAVDIADCLTILKKVVKLIDF